MCPPQIVLKRTPTTRAVDLISPASSVLSDNYNAGLNRQFLVNWQLLFLCQGLRCHRPRAVKMDNFKQVLCVELSLLRRVPLDWSRAAWLTR